MPRTGRDSADSVGKPDGVHTEHRASEAQVADVTFNAESMVVKIESSKTDQYQNGAS